MIDKQDFEKRFKEKLEGMTSFPARIKFALLRDYKTGEFSILNTVVKGNLAKKKIENVKFDECQTHVFSGSTVALHVGDYQTAEDVLKKTNELHKAWCGEVQP